MKEYFCLFCNGPETSYQPQCDFICSGCIQLLCDADQDDLKRAHAKAVRLGLSRKVEALESFIEEEEFYDREAKKLERNMARTRSVRNTGRSYHQNR